jgi:hypothetical protein
MYFSSLFVSLPLFSYFLWKRGFLRDFWRMICGLLFGSIIIIGTSLILIYYIIIPAMGLPSIPDLDWIFISIKPMLESSLLWFVSGYELVKIFFLLIGLSVCILAVFRKKIEIHPWVDNVNFEFLLLVSGTYLIVFFMPLTLGYRTELFVRHLNSLCITLGALFTVLLVSRVFTWIRTRKKTDHESALKIPDSILIFALSMLLLFASIGSGINEIRYFDNGEPTYLEPDEMTILTWLNNNIPKNAYIVTDICTGYLIRGFLLRNASTSFIIKGIAKGVFEYPELTQLISLFLNAASWNSAIQYYNQIIANPIIQEVSNHTYLVITQRTSSWIRLMREGRIERYLSTSYWRPLNSNDQAWMKFFDEGFQSLKTSGESHIIKITTQNQTLND